MPFGGLLTVGAIGAGSSIFSGILGANASNNASQQYVQALQQAMQEMQGQEAQGLQNYAPYLSAGSTATKELSSLLGTPGSGLLTPWDKTFTAPTAAQAEQTPGYQFQLKAGQDAMQNSAAGKGSLLTGRTMADLNNYSQGVASTNYQNTFNNAFTEYNSAYNTFRNNQNDTYSRLLGVSGQGLQAAGGAGNFMSGMSGDIASLYGGMGAARAGGTMGAANAYGGMFGGLSSDASTMLLMRMLQGKQNSTAQVPGGGGFQIPSTDPSTGVPWTMPGANG